MYLCAVQIHQQHKRIWGKLSWLIPLLIGVLIFSPCSVQSNVLESLNVDYVQGLNKKKCSVQETQTDVAQVAFVKVKSLDNGNIASIVSCCNTITVLQKAVSQRQWTVTLKRFIRYSQLKIHVVE